MGIVQNIAGFVRDIHDRQRAAKIDDQLKNYMNDPEATISAISQFAPREAIALKDQLRQQDAAATAQDQARMTRDYGMMRDVLRGMPPGADLGAAVDQIAPFLSKEGGISPERILGFKTLLTTNPNAAMDEKAYEAWIKDQTTNTVAPVGSHVIRGGKVIDRVPYGIKSVNTPAGATSTPFDPNTGRFGIPATPPIEQGGPGPDAGGIALPPGGNVPSGNPLTPPQPQTPLSATALAPVFKAQESGGDYTAVNKDTGALGAYQVMPNTGRALAAKLGMPWRPDMMAKNDPASQRYQDAIGQAAIQESVDFSGGDPAKLFSHYYGGPDQEKWGPRTRQYTTEMLARLGSGGQGGGNLGGATVTPGGVYNPPKPSTKPTYRAATKEELAAAGYPEGTAAQIGSDGKMVNVKTPPAAAQIKPYDMNRANDFLTSMGRVHTLAKSMLDSPGLDQAVGSIQGHAPGWLLGQSAQDFINDYDTLRSQIGLNELLRFKATSAQGASGFGNLSNEEGRRLENAWATFMRTSSEPKMRASLRTIMEITGAGIQRTQNMMDDAQAGINPNSPRYDPRQAALPRQGQQAAPQPGEVRRGYRFKGGNPADQRSWEKVQ